MEKKLKKTGASYCVIIPKAILDLLQIDPKHNLVKMRVEGDELIIKKGSSYED